MRIRAAAEPAAPQPTAARKATREPDTLLAPSPTPARDPFAPAYPPDAEAARSTPAEPALEGAGDDSSVRQLSQAQTADIEAYEQEADRIAGQVVAMPAHSRPPAALRPSAVRPIGRLDEASTSASQTLADPGRPLEPDLRQDMERRFGYDFSHMRLHTGATAERSARDVHADAYTTGNNVVFGVGQFAPNTQQGRRLIAHELTHVVQQSRAPSPAGPARPGLIQRQKTAARARVEAAMARLKDKFGLAEVTEENGATWSESELAKVDGNFSKIARKDQPLLKGLHLVRTDKLESKKLGRETFAIAGTTFGTSTIKLVEGAFRGDSRTILHEAGHLINNKVAEAVLGKSKAKVDLDVARLRVGQAQRLVPTLVGAGLSEYGLKLKQLAYAAGNLLLSGESDQAAMKSALDEAKVQAELARPNVPDSNAAGAAELLEVHQSLDRYSDTVEGYLRERGAANLAGFVEVVKRHNLARQGYAPFTKYVAAHWPAAPKEYFAESFQVWRNNPQYMKERMRPLFDWFEKGGHREGKGYLEGKSDLEQIHELAPVIYELGREVKETFVPKPILGN